MYNTMNISLFSKPLGGNQSLLKWFAKSPAKSGAKEEVGGPSKKIKTEV